MSDLQLHLESREQRKKQNAVLRKQGYAPAVLYGRKLENQNLKVRVQEFKKVFNKAGQSALIDLVLPGDQIVKGLIQDVQWDPVSSELVHLDLHQVRMDEKLHTEIPIRFDGIAPAVKELGGTLVKSLEHVKVECLPDALVPELTLDISSLKTFEDQLTVADLPCPEGIKLLHEPNEVLALVAPPHVEEAAPEKEGATEGTAEGEKAAEEAGSEVTTSKKQEKKPQTEK